MRIQAVLPAIVLCLSSCGSELPLPLDPGSAEEQLRARVDTMLAEGFLTPFAPRKHPDGTTELFGQLDQVDLWLDEIARWDGSQNVPEWWEPEVAPSLDGRLKDLDAFYSTITVLLRSSKNVDALERGESLAYRTSIRSNEEEPDAYATPPLPRMLRWIDLLCAKAVETGSSSIDADVALRCLSEAFDLLRLLDDGSMEGRSTCAALESRVLLALRLVAPGPTIDPVALQREMEPRLAAIGDRARPWETLRNAISRRIEITLELLDHPDRPDEDHWLAELDTSRARLAARALDAIHVQDELRNASTLCVRIKQFGREHPFQDLIDTVDALHQIGSACYVARVGLAANAYRFTEGDWPRYLSDLIDQYIDRTTPPLSCRTMRPEYKRGFRDVRVAVSGRMSRADNRDPDPLFEWTWSADVISQFPRRLH